MTAVNSDPTVEMQAEFDRLNQEEQAAGIEDEYLRDAYIYARFVNSRLQEIVQIRAYAAQRTAMLQRQIDNATYLIDSNKPRSHIPKTLSVCQNPT